MMIYRTLVGEQINLEDLPPLDLDNFIFFLEEAGGGDLLGSFQYGSGGQELPEAVRGWGGIDLREKERYDAFCDGLQDPATFWSLFKNTGAVSRSSRTREKYVTNTALWKLASDLQLRLGCIHHLWKPDRVARDPRAFLWSALVRAGSLSRLATTQAIKLPQASKLFATLRNVWRGEDETAEGNAGPAIIGVEKLESSVRVLGLTCITAPPVPPDAAAYSAEPSTRDLRVAKLGVKLERLLRFRRRSPGVLWWEFMWNARDSNSAEPWISPEDQIVLGQSLALGGMHLAEREQLREEISRQGPRRQLGILISVPVPPTKRALLNRDEQSILLANSLGLFDVGAGVDVYVLPVASPISGVNVLVKQVGPNVGLLQPDESFAKALDTGLYKLQQSSRILVKLQALGYLNALEAAVGIGYEREAVTDPSQIHERTKKLLANEPNPGRGGGVSASAVPNGPESAEAIQGRMIADDRASRHHQLTENA